MTHLPTMCKRIGSGLCALLFVASLSLTGCTTDGLTGPDLQAQTDDGPGSCQSGCSGHTSTPLGHNE